MYLCFFDASLNTRELLRQIQYYTVGFGVVVSDIGQINGVTLLQARYVLGWVTASGVQLPVWEIYLSPTNHAGQLSLAIPPWVGAMSTGQRAVMLCDWEDRQIWCCLQVTLCDPYLSALKALAHRRAIQIHVYFTLLYFTLLNTPRSKQTSFHK